MKVQVNHKYEHTASMQQQSESLEFMVSAADGTGSQSMTLDEDGNLLVGTTTTPSLAGLAVGSTTTGKNISVFSSANGTNGPNWNISIKRHTRRTTLRWGQET